jgi:uncharacterized protein (DUF305 family)
MNHPLVRRAALVAATVSLAGSLAGSARAQTPDADHDAHHDGTPVASICAALDARQATPAPMTGGMHGGMAMGTPAAGMIAGQSFDLMFIDMMIPHHEGAVEMAQIALERSQRPEIRELALAVIDSQSEEIGQLNEWRQAWYPDAPLMPMDQMTGAMDMMSGDMSHSMHGGAMATPGAMAGSGMAMDMSAEIAALCELEGDDFDLAFIDAMIPHHRDAVAMAVAVAAQSERQEILGLSEAIVAAQEDEIARMTEWRAAWFPDAPAAQD